jgi:hypothetical protein
MTAPQETAAPQAEAAEPAADATPDTGVDTADKEPSSADGMTPGDGTGDGATGSATGSATDEGLADETAAPDAEWASSRDRQSRQADEGLRSLGIDPDAPSRAARPLPDHATGNRTGAKIAMGHFATAAEHIENHFTGTLPNRARGGQLPAALIEATTRTYVRTAEHSVLRDTLLRHGVAYTSGPEGTGRLATAHAVLAELCGSDKVVTIDLNDDADLTAVVDDDDVLLAGHGHVLELSASQPVPHKQRLATAGARVASRQGYLVVIGPAGLGDRALDPYEVPHHPPAAADVLDRHLPHLVRTLTNWSDERAAGFVADCRSDPAVVAQLRTTYQPCEVVQLARRLVEVGRRGGQPAEALELLPGALRELAVSVLRAAKENGDVNTLRRLTARIAFALYSGRPLTVVFELASLLFAALPDDEIADPAESSPLVRTVFEGGMESLIDDRMRANRDDDGDDERLARLVDPELALAVLDVVWHEYDHLRAPIFAWLRVLGRDPRQSIRMRTGQLAGQLALYDFGETYRELLRPWATSPSRLHRQSAAWAMERAVLEPKLTARACAQVRDWTYSQDVFMNDTAARCYATRLGTEFADEPLLHLGLVALRGEHVVSPAVAQAVAQLHEPDKPESGLAILRELAAWTRDDIRSLHVHAARAVTFLAHWTAPPPDERWPALLHLADQDPEAWDLLIELWRAALTEFMVAARGWQMLLAWLCRPEEAGDLADVTVVFATELLRSPLVRSRALFHLTQWLPRYPDTPVLGRLRDNLRKDES